MSQTEMARATSHPLESKGNALRNFRSALLAAFAAAGLGGCLGCGPDEPECPSIENANVGYGYPRGAVTFNAYLQNGANADMPIRAHFEIRNSFGECFKGTTTKHVNLTPDTYTVDWFPITDPIELGEIRRKTGYVGDVLPVDLEDPALARYKQIDVTDKSETVSNGLYNP